MTQVVPLQAPDSTSSNVITFAPALAATLPGVVARDTCCGPVGVGPVSS